MSLGLLLYSVGIPLVVLVFVGLVLVIVFGQVRAATARARAALAHEGIVLDSGPTWVTEQFRDFRGARPVSGCRPDEDARRSRADAGGPDRLNSPGRAAGTG